MSSRKPNAADRAIAAELRVLREEAGLIQEDAATFLDITYQQYGKYERAEDRISAARYKALREFLLTKVRAAKGLSEEEAAYDSGPGAQFDIDAIQKEWEGLKRRTDAFFKKLRRRR